MPTVKNKPKIRVSQNSLNNTAWLAFLAEGLHYLDDQHFYVDHPLDGTQTRALYRWRHESGATFFSADRWITKTGRHINEFFTYCDRIGVSPWASGSPPDWHERNDWQEDLKSSDPKWRAEAKAKRR